MYCGHDPTTNLTHYKDPNHTKCTKIIQVLTQTKQITLANQPNTRLTIDEAN